MSLTFYLFVVLTLSYCGHASEEETRENWTYTCPGQAVSSACVNNACTIICSDGIKVNKNIFWTKTKSLYNGADAHYFTTLGNEKRHLGLTCY